jgi:hypothetical protein
MGLWVAALKVLAHRPQPRARSPKELVQATPARVATRSREAKEVPKPINAFFLSPTKESRDWR